MEENLELVGATAIEDNFDGKWVVEKNGVKYFDIEVKNN